MGWWLGAWLGRGLAVWLDWCQVDSWAGGWLGCWLTRRLAVARVVGWVAAQETTGNDTDKEKKQSNKQVGAQGKTNSQSNKQASKQTEAEPETETERECCRQAGVQAGHQTCLVVSPLLCFWFSLCLYLGSLCLPEWAERQ